MGLSVAPPSNCMWSCCQSHWVFSNCIAFHWQCVCVCVSVGRNAGKEQVLRNSSFELSLVNMDCTYGDICIQNMCINDALMHHIMFKSLTLTQFIHKDVITILAFMYSDLYTCTRRHNGTTFRNMNTNLPTMIPYIHTQNTHLSLLLHMFLNCCLCACWLCLLPYGIVMS